MYVPSLIHPVRTDQYSSRNSPRVAGAASLSSRASRGAAIAGVRQNATASRRNQQRGVESFRLSGVCLKNAIGLLRVAGCRAFVANDSEVPSSEENGRYCRARNLITRN